MSAVAPLHLPERVTHQAGDIEQIIGAPDRGLVRLRVAVLLEDVEHTLRNRQIARRQQDQAAIVRALEHLELGECGDAIDSGAGARVRGKQDPGVEANGYAVGHGLRPKPEPQRKSAKAAKKMELKLYQLSFAPVSLLARTPPAESAGDSITFRSLLRPLRPLRLCVEVRF